VFTHGGFEPLILKVRKIRGSRKNFLVELKAFRVMPDYFAVNGGGLQLAPLSKIRQHDLYLPRFHKIQTHAYITNDR
jgi:hypothetical protein